MRRPAVIIAMVLGALGALALPGSALGAHKPGAHCDQVPPNAPPGSASVTQPVGTGTVSVYADADGSAGLTGTADVAAGACADGLATGGFDGGTVEAGTSAEDPGVDDAPLHPAQPTRDAYVVADGDNDNVDPFGQSDGYIGVSNYETGTTSRTGQTACTSSGPDNGQQGTSNSGGCVGKDGGPWVYVPGDVPTPVCGNTSGNGFDGQDNSEPPPPDPTAPHNQRDGCSVP